MNEQGAYHSHSSPAQCQLIPVLHYWRITQNRAYFHIHLGPQRPEALIIFHVLIVPLPKSGQVALVVSNFS